MENTNKQGTLIFDGLKKYMKNLSFILVTTTAILFSAFAQSQTVDELQAKYVSALGGKEKLSTLKNVYQEAEMEIMGMQIPAKVWIVYDTGSRQELEIQGQTMVTYIGKTEGWMINPLMGSTAAQPLPDEMINNAGGLLSAGGELANYKLNGYTAVYEGRDSVNGVLAHKIKLSKNEIETTIYLDASNYYTIRNVSRANINGQQVEQVTSYSNYRKTPEGYVFPYSSVINNPMVGEINATVKKIEVNTALDVKELGKTN